MNLTQINEQINKLSKKRDELLATQEEDKIQQIKSLEWTKECDAYLRKGGIGYGSPKYEIHITGNVPVLNHTNYISFNGFAFSVAKPSYNNTFVIGFYNFTGFSFHNLEPLIQFIKTVKFRSFIYDKEEFEVMSTIKENYER